MHILYMAGVCICNVYTVYEGCMCVMYMAGVCVYTVYGGCMYI